MDARTQIANAYQTYLGRPASAQELDWRVGKLGVTALPGQLSDISNSPEATAFRAKQSSGGDLFGAVKQQGVERQAMLDKQNALQEGLFKKYETTSKGQEALPALYSRLNTELGIPDLSNTAQVFKTQIYNTKDLLDRLEEDINTRTSGTFTNEAQRNRQLAYERNPLETQLARLGTGLQPVSEMLSSAQGQLSTLLPLYEQQQQKELNPLEMRISAVSDRFAREISGFDSQKENELNAIMDKIQRGRQLSDREWQAAQDLAASERDFAQKKALIAAQARADQGGGLKIPAGSTTPVTSTKTVADWQALGGGSGSGLTPISGGGSISFGGGKSIPVSGGGLRF